jgi:PAS domain S-box-containing protein
MNEIVASQDLPTNRNAFQYARSLIEASLDPLVTISPEGKITDVNEATVKVTGVSRELLIGTDFSDYFTEPMNARSGYQEAFEKGFVTDYPLTIRHNDGRLTDVPTMHRYIAMRVATRWAFSPPLATSHFRSRRQATPQPDRGES